MSIYDKIYELTIHELKVAQQHPDWTESIAKFFAAGGYAKEPQETIDAIYAVVFNKGENHGT